MNSNTDSICVEKCRVREDNSGSNNESLGLTLFRCMKKYRSRVLQYFADTNETDTYEEVLIRSIRTALKLKEIGIGRRDIVSTCSHNHKNNCIPVLAAFFLGAITANFDPSLSHLDTIYLLKLVKPKIIFISQESLPFMEKCLAESETTTELVIFGESTMYSQFDEYLKPRSEEESFNPTPIDDARETTIMLFSSGTTGLPKGICLSHHTILGHINNGNTFLVHRKDANPYTSLTYATFYWISAVAYFLETIAIGNSRVVCSKFDPYQAWKIIEKYKVLCTFLPPHFANELLLHRPKYVDVSSLEIFSIGSSFVTKRLMEDLRIAFPNSIIQNVYGQTEAACYICKFDENKPEEVEMQNRKPLSCGKIRPNFLWKVVDLTTKKVLGPNEKGELRVKSDFFMNGYYQMDTSSAFDSDGYLKTGDIVYYDEEECFYIVDRIKEAFKYKGWHILPVITENVLMSHPAVKEAAVIGVPVDLDGEHAMGIVVLYDEFKYLTPSEIEVFVEGKVPEIQRLRAGVKIVKELIRTATGKVKRRALKEKVLSGEI